MDTDLYDGVPGRDCRAKSNMWLPMNMDTSRNVTYDAIMKGKHSRPAVLLLPLRCLLSLTLCPRPKAAGTPGRSMVR